MSRAIFMAKLREGLAGLSPAEIEEIICDYEFHFSEGVATGQSEDLIAAKLGDPIRLAKEILQENELRRCHTQRFVTLAPKWHRPVLLFLFFASMLMLIAGSYGVLQWLRRPTYSANPLKAATTTATIMISGGQIRNLGQIEQARLYLAIDGGAQIMASGHVKELTVRVDGSGKAAFQGLQADIAHIDLSGTGEIDVQPSQLAEITISGSGTVRLWSKPTILKQSVTGSGRVILSGPSALGPRKL